MYVNLINDLNSNGFIRLNFDYSVTNENLIIGENYVKKCGNLNYFLDNTDFNNKIYRGMFKDCFENIYEKNSIFDDNSSLSFMYTNYIDSYEIYYYFLKNLILNIKFLPITQEEKRGYKNFNSTYLVEIVDTNESFENLYYYDIHELIQKIKCKKELFYDQKYASEFIKENFNKSSTTLFIQNEDIFQLTRRETETNLLEILKNGYSISFKFFDNSTKNFLNFVNNAIYGAVKCDICFINNNCDEIRSSNILIRESIINIENNSLINNSIIIVISNDTVSNKTENNSIINNSSINEFSNETLNNKTDNNSLINNSSINEISNETLNNKTDNNSLINNNTFNLSPIKIEDNDKINNNPIDKPLIINQNLTPHLNDDIDKHQESKNTTNTKLIVMNNNMEVEISINPLKNNTEELNKYLNLTSDQQINSINNLTSKLDIFSSYLSNEKDNKNNSLNNSDKIIENLTSIEKISFLHDTIILNTFISNTNCSKMQNFEDEKECRNQIYVTQNNIVNTLKVILNCTEIFKIVFGDENPKKSFILTALSLFYSTSNYNTFGTTSFIDVNDITQCLIKESSKIIEKILKNSTDPTENNNLKKDFIEIVSKTTSNMVNIAKESNINILDTNNNYDDFKNGSLIINSQNLQVKTIIEENAINLMKLEFDKFEKNDNLNFSSSIDLKNESISSNAYKISLNNVNKIEEKQNLTLKTQNIIYFAKKGKT